MYHIFESRLNSQLFSKVLILLISYLRRYFFRQFLRSWLYTSFKAHKITQKWFSLTLPHFRCIWCAEFWWYALFFQDKYWHSLKIPWAPARHVQRVKTKTCRHIFRSGCTFPSKTVRFVPTHDPLCTTQQGPDTSLLPWQKGKRKSSELSKTERRPRYKAIGGLISFAVNLKS